MQHLDHDMDELFKKAAENYSLKESKSDWDAVSSRLTNVSPQEKPDAKPVLRKKHLTAILLLLLVLLISDIIIRMTGEGHKSIEQVATINVKDVPTIQKSLQAGGNISNDSAATGIIRDTAGIENVLQHYINSKDKNSTARFSVIDAALTTSGSHEKSLKKITGQVDLTREGISPSLSLKERMRPKLIIEMPTLSNLNKNHRFYWGIVAGPQFSEVKKQGLTKTGFEAGFLAGFRATRNLSIETGLYHATKYYFSDAKYFTMAKPDPTMPANMVMMDIAGKSNIVEIPVKLKLDVVDKTRNSFFVTAGVSSYLLIKENNSYHMMVNGNPEYMFKSYKQASNYTAASIQFSAGYQRQLNNKSSLRIEPYLQIPLKGIGVGAMPVTSAGLHIAIISGKAH